MGKDLRRYFEQSRTLSVSFIVILPLLLAYEVGIVVTGSPVENYAGLLVERLISLLGMDAYAALTGLVCATFFLALVSKRRGPARSFRLYGLILVEATLYAALLAPIVHGLERAPMWLSSAGGTRSIGLRILLYFGAGVWEELVFRFALLGGFVYLTVRVLKGNAIVFKTLGVMATSLAFSLFHNLGPMGEPFRTGPFLFRFFAGVVLAVIYLYRGLGVGVYTHAFYNIGLMMFG